MPPAAWRAFGRHWETNNAAGGCAARCLSAAAAGELSVHASVQSTAQVEVVSVLRSDTPRKARDEGTRAELSVIPHAIFAIGARLNRGQARGDLRLAPLRGQYLLEHACVPHLQLIGSGIEKPAVEAGIQAVYLPALHREPGARLAGPDIKGCNPFDPAARGEVEEGSSRRHRTVPGLGYRLALRQRSSVVCDQTMWNRIPPRRSATPPLGRNHGRGGPPLPWSCRRRSCQVGASSTRTTPSPSSSIPVIT